MERILIALLLLPVFSQAQIVELSLKAGAAFSNAGHQAVGLVEVEKPLAYCGSLSATAGIPGGIRLGVGVSVLRLGFATVFTFPNGVKSSTGYQYGNPLMPIELIAAKRIKFSKLAIDLGGMGGICANSETKMQLDDVQQPIITKSKETWFTYGFLVGAQYKLNKRMSAGIEAQPKWLDIRSKGFGVFMTLVMLKVSFGI
jgi:hypothetical protein